MQIEGPDDAVVRHALQRGHLTAAQVEAARALAGAGSVLPFLQRHLSPAQLAELAEVYQQAIAGRAPGPDAVAGRRVGPYVVERELARGGMGVVSIARHVELGRRVALKEMLASAAVTERLRQRFVREGQALARVTHPGVVRVFEVGQGPAGPFMALELVEGESLAERLARAGPAPPVEAAGWIEQAARAIHFAHGQGLLHRDLKPANLLLAADGAVKVTDFGVARDLEAESLTRTGQMVGTPAFMPPEQRFGAKAAMDGRSDVYALGATLYALVTDDVLPPAAGWADQAPDLETLVARAVEAAPADRYPTAEAFADDLARFRAGEPIAARRLSSAERIVRWSRRRSGLAAGLATTAALGLVAAAIAVRARSAAAATPVVRVGPHPAATRGRRVELRGRVRGGLPPLRVRALADARAAALGEVAVAPDGRFALSVPLRPGANALRLVAIDADGVRSEPRLVAVVRDAGPPGLTWGDPPRHLRPFGVLRGALSEPGCTIRVGAWARHVPGTSFRIEVPGEVLEAQRQVTVEDAAGNAAVFPLPFRVVRTVTDLSSALEGGGGGPVFLAPGEYALDPRRDLAGLTGADWVLSGVAPMPAGELRRVARGLDLDLAVGRGEDPSAQVAQVSLRRSGLGLKTDGGTLTLRDLSIEASFGGGVKEPALWVQGGALRLERVRARSSGLVLDVEDGAAHLASTTIVAAGIHGVRVVGGTLELRDTWVVGEFSAATAGGRAASVRAGKAFWNDGLVTVGRGGRLVAEDSALERHVETGLSVEAGGQAELTGCRLVGHMGRAIHLEGGSLSLRRALVQGTRGVGLLVRGRSSCLVADTRFQGNGGFDARPSVDLEGHGAAVELRACEVVDGPGIGVRIRGLPGAPGAPVRLTRVRVRGHRVGVDVAGAARAVLTDCAVSDNEVDGVAVHVGEGDAVGPEVWLTGGELSRNGASGTGAGLRAARALRVQVEGVRFEGNASGPRR